MSATAPKNESRAVDLSGFGNVVPAGYQYVEKHIVPHDELALPTAILKWYDLFPAEEPISPEQRAECRAFITAEAAQLGLGADLGFVILHRAGSVLLLMVSTWRNTNEMWESVYVNDPSTSAGYVRVRVDGHHRPTYCVWELGAVWHERGAWVRFIQSERDNSAKRAYLDDLWTGLL